MNTVELARAAGVHPLAMSEEYISGLERLVALVRADEREACAKVCDTEPSLPHETYTVRNNKATMRRCAAAIRARGQA